ncbi:MAG: hypothetical protein ACP5G5_02155 [Thermoplasmata archaeon]
MISYTYPTSTTGVAPKVYLAQGPNYAAANAMGLFYANQVGSPANISSGTKIYFNYTYGASNEALLNVLEIVNNAPSGVTVKLTFDTLSLPTGVTMYISSSVNSTLSYSVSAGGIIKINGGSQVSTGIPFTLSSGTYYIGFLFSSSAQPGTGTIAFHYEIG